MAQRWRTGEHTHHQLDDEAADDDPRARERRLRRLLLLGHGGHAGAGALQDEAEHVDGDEEGQDAARRHLAGSVGGAEEHEREAANAKVGGGKEGGREDTHDLLCDVGVDVGRLVVAEHAAEDGVSRRRGQRQVLLLTAPWRRPRRRSQTPASAARDGPA
jgi:hypothetical protein